MNVAAAIYAGPGTSQRDRAPSVVLDSRYERLTDTERRAKPSSVALVSAADTLVRHGLQDLGTEATPLTQIADRDTRKFIFDTGVTTIYIRLSAGIRPDPHIRGRFLEHNESGRRT